MHWIDFDRTYSLVMDMITFPFLIGRAEEINLEMCLMYIVNAYSYGLLEIDMLIKISEGLRLLN